VQAGDVTKNAASKPASEMDRMAVLQLSEFDEGRAGTTTILHYDGQKAKRRPLTQSPCHDNVDNTALCCVDVNRPHEADSILG
jgi:hypothetical protein